MTRNVELIEGGISVDDRGELTFCNDFDMKSVERFYQVSNHANQFIRAWHAHKNESKYVFVSSGTVLVATVQIDDWEKPSKELKYEKFILSEKTPRILFIPNGYAHGYKTLTDKAKVIFFSTSSLEKSSKDDYRYDAFYWNPWDVVER
tara:strand:- start:50 stop:493 length:444 start_codon:yes stop_codon:yes gene_type:complete